MDLNQTRDGFIHKLQCFREWNFRYINLSLV